MTNITQRAVAQNKAQAPKIKFAVNCAGRDKNWDFEQLATQFRDVEGSIDDVLESVLNGHALCASTLGNRRRSKSNVVGSNWVLVDIDNSDAKLDENGKPIKGEKVYKHQMTLEEALKHPFVQKHCALIYTTASHKPDWHKFRLIFLFPTFVDGADIVEQAIRLLLEQFPHDPACKDASRVFYGSSKAEIPLINENATLPANWVEKAKQAAEAQRIETEKRLQEIGDNREKYQLLATSEGWDTDALIEQALSYIPPRCPGSNNYQECTQVLMALVNHYGAAQAEVIGERWSPSIKGDTWDVGKKIRSYKRDGVTIGTLFHIAKQYGFRFPAPKNKFTKFKTMSENNAKKVSVPGDSAFSGDASNQDVLSVSATVTSVTEILKLGLKDYEERHELDAVESISILDKDAFKRLVASVKCGLDEVMPEDEIRLNNLIDWHNAKLDFREALPAMASEIIKDAQTLNVEPILIWQALMPAVLSFTGVKISVDLESHTVPSNVNTISVLESGGGKTRADQLVYAPMKVMQETARKRFDAEMQAWQEETKENKGEGDLPTRPVERKYLFEIATIQAVLKRISEQQEHGQVWNRDEIAGLFKSLGQFNKGENEGLEILLKLYDGSSVQNDRVKQEDSYFIGKTALSINGGIQPGKFRDIFKDVDDSQGVLARFLIAVPQPLLPKRKRGHCYLAETLPKIYNWLDSLSSGTVKLSDAADRYYTHLYNEIGKQAYQQSHPAIRAWMKKLPTQLIRIALALHLIECYHDENKPIWEIQKDTLQRAVLFAQYYRSAYQVVTEISSPSDDMSSILLKIWDAALIKHVDGITPREAYRNVKAIQYRAKDAGRDAGAYTIDLFYKLQEMGKGVVKKIGRVTKFVAEPSPITLTPVEENQNIQNTVTVVTVAEKHTGQRIEVSPQKQVSPVTVETSDEIFNEFLPIKNDEDENQIDEDDSVGTETVGSILDLNRFDAKDKAEVMVSCLEAKHGDLLLKLVDELTSEQKAEVRKHLTPEQYSDVRRLLVDARNQNSDTSKESAPVEISDKTPNSPSTVIEDTNEPPKTDSVKALEESAPVQIEKIKVGARVKVVESEDKRCGEFGKVTQTAGHSCKVILDSDKSVILYHFDELEVCQ
jgi:Protein of unknown function (DUF3987)/Primase C terminal 2 (PriCT-2)